MANPLSRWRKWLLAPLLTLTMALPAAAAPVGADRISIPGNAVSVAAVQPGAVTAEVDAGLKAELAAGGQKTFLVYLKVRADVDALSAAARAQASAQGATPRTQRLAAATAVVNGLKDVAEKTQAGLVPTLASLQAKGNIREYQRFWITNVIAVTGDETALTALSERPEVAKIAPSTTVHALGAQEKAEVDAATQALAEAAGGRCAVS